MPATLISGSRSSPICRPPRRRSPASPGLCKVGVMADDVRMKSGVGARVARKEDDRHLRGRGQFIGDMKMTGMLEVAFLRSPVAHGRIKRIDIPEAYRRRVFIAGDLTDVKPIRAVS